MNDQDHKTAQRGADSVQRMVRRGPLCADGLNKAVDELRDLVSGKTDPTVIVAEGYYRIKAENERLRDWIRDEGERTDTCTFDVLGEICKGCRCQRAPNAQDQTAVSNQQPKA